MRPDADPDDHAPAYVIVYVLFMVVALVGAAAVFGLAYLLFG